MLEKWIKIERPKCERDGFCYLQETLVQEQHELLQTPTVQHVQRGSLLMVGGYFAQRCFAAPEI